MKSGDKGDCEKLPNIRRSPGKSGDLEPLPTYKACMHKAISGTEWPLFLTSGGCGYAGRSPRVSCPRVSCPWKRRYGRSLAGARRCVQISRNFLSRTGSQNTLSESHDKNFGPFNINEVKQDHPCLHGVSRVGTTGHPQPGAKTSQPASGTQPRERRQSSW